MNYTILPIVLFVLLFSFDVFSQTSKPKTQTLPRTRPMLQDNSLLSTTDDDSFKIGDITGKVGNVRIIYLQKPSYPDEAKIIGAEGTVRVEVIFDADGNIASAKNISGNEALFDAARNAALKSRFIVPKPSENVSIFINYNFIIETPNWFKVGYDLGIIGLTQPSVIGKAFATDWTQENQAIQQLQKLKLDQPQNNNKPQFIRKSVQTTSGNSRISQEIRGELILPKPNTEMITIGQNLISMLRTRLANDPSKLWQFNLGLAFLEVQYSFRNPNTRQNAFLIIQQFRNNIPNDVSPIYGEKMKELIEMSNQKPMEEVREEIVKTIIVFKNVK